MATVEDNVYETAGAPGAGTISLAGTISGRRTFVSVFASGTVVFYGITDGANWESGIGTFTTGSPNTLSRTTVLDNSLNNTSKINFAASVSVFGVSPSRRQILANVANDAVDFGTRKGSNLVSAVLGSDIPRFDQVGWVQIGSPTVIGTAVASVIFSLTGGYSRYRLEWQGMTCASAVGTYMQVSVNSGSTYLSGASDYDNQYILGTGASGNATTTQISTTYATLSGVPAASTQQTGFIEIDVTAGDHIFFGKTTYLTAAGPTNLFDFGGRIDGSALALTNLVFGFVGANTTNGRIRLLGGM